jgi:class 3 adenylate cyclase/pimeloyl-ACP methyl ester carboxylesterase
MSGTDSSGGVHDPPVAWVVHDGRSIAYQAVGSGPRSLLLLDDWWTHLDLEWDDPFRARWLRRVAASARLIRFDKSGMGLSDRVPPLPPEAMAVWADEAIAVLDVLGVETAQLLVCGWSGPLGAVLASRYPRRFDRVAFATAFVRLRGAGDPPGVDPSIVDAGEKVVLAQWGSGILTDVLGQSRDEVPDAQHRLDCRLERSSVAPADLPAVVNALLNADATSCLPEIEADTLVVHGLNPLLPEEHSRYVADHIRDARLEIVKEQDWRYPFAEDQLLLPWLVALAFLTDSPYERDLQHQLFTIVFIDIVGSTPFVQRVGDREWSESLEAFTEALHLNLAHYKGRLAGSAGDGFFLAFDSPRRALRFTLATSEKAAALGLPVRAGIHAGECHVEGTELRGLAVHATARIMDQAGAGEVFVSSVVRQLLDDQHLSFAAVGTRQLRGVPGSWELFAAQDSDAS